MLSDNPWPRVMSCSDRQAVAGSKDEEGRPRLENPEDFVRVEISAALDRDVPVIPVLVGGSRMPRSRDLPESIAKIARRNALEIPDWQFSQSVSRLGAFSGAQTSGSLQDTML